MGSLLAKCIEKLKPRVRIIMVGLEFSGKTTIIYKLRLGEVTESLGKKFMRYEVVQFRNFELVCWDIIFHLFPQYSDIDYDNFRGIIFVIDSSDREKLDDAGKRLKEIVLRDRGNNSPLLVLLNKSDLTGYISCDEFCKRFDMDSIIDRPWLVHQVCAITGAGLNEGFDWLIKLVSNN